MRRLALSRALRLTALVPFLAASSAAVGLYACGNGDDDDDASKDGGASGDGATTDGTTTPGSDATTPGTDAAPGSDGSSPPADGSTPGKDGGDSGSGGDAGDGGAIRPLGSCAAPFIVDTSAGAVSQDVWAESFNGKWVIGWGQNVSPPHMRARYFDGTTMMPEVDLGPIALQAAASGVDQSGVAYAIGFGQTSPTTFRTAFDLVAGQSISTSNVASRMDDTTSYSVAGLPHGALAVYQAAALAEVGDVYTSGAGWSYTGAVPAANQETVDGPTTFTHVAVNAAGKGGASWTDTITGNGRRLYVSTFDGTSLSTPVTRDFPGQTGGTPEYFDSAALSNGDLAFVWSSAGLAGVTFATFHVSSGTWDADMVVDTFTGAVLPTIPKIFADADDDLTVVWTRPSQNENQPLVAVRRLGGTWGSILTLATTPQPVTAAIDPNGNVVVAENIDAVPNVTRIAAKGIAFDPPVPTGLPVVNDSPALRIVFGATGDPVLVDFGLFDGGVHVVAVNCLSQP